MKCLEFEDDIECTKYEPGFRCPGPVEFEEIKLRCSKTEIWGLTLYALYFSIKSVLNAVEGQETRSFIVQFLTRVQIHVIARPCPAYLRLVFQHLLEDSFFAGYWDNAQYESSVNPVKGCCILMNTFCEQATWSPAPKPAADRHTLPDISGSLQGLLSLPIPQ